MRLVVLVPSEEYKSYAGARIRYDRIQPALNRLGIELSLVDIGQFDPRQRTADAILISKCHDARAIVAAAATAARGALVGVDLFDDYFSDWTESRLIRYRSWLAQLLKVCDFALCSTERMASVVQQYRDSLPALVMNDPAPEFARQMLSRTVATKLSNARHLGRVRVGWFGVGDNPYFPVGLADLSAYASALGELLRSRMAVELTVLTNRRSLNAEGLSLIRQLPIPVRVREWNATAERELLNEALVAFLPVSWQPFSKSKSLNRAVTALTSGCQVISIGYPLYAAMERFIYRDVLSFVDDLGCGNLRLSSRNMNEFCETILAVAGTDAEAGRIAKFLSCLESHGRPSLPLSLIHGHSTRGEVHTMVRALNGMSVASPYCTALLDFDVVFRGHPRDLEMLVSKKTSGRLLPHIRTRLGRRQDIRGHRYFRVAGERSGSPVDSVAVQLATYNETMREIEWRMTDAFGPSQLILSETSHIPFPAPAWAA